MRNHSLKDRQFKEPPPDWVARVSTVLRRRFPDAVLAQSVMRKVYTLLKWQWRFGYSAEQAARTLFRCDGGRIEARPIAEIESLAPRDRHPVSSMTAPPLYIFEAGSDRLGLLGAGCALPAALVLAMTQGRLAARMARYCLTSASKLITSHLLRRNFAENPAYPGAVSERAYDRCTAEQMKVVCLAQNCIPALVFNSQAAFDGPPLVTREGLVIGGNGRVMALQLHYLQGGETARDYLLDHAEAFGFTTAHVEAIPEPVVVRVIETFGLESQGHVQEMQEMVRLLNIPIMASLDPHGEIVPEARCLTDEVFDTLLVTCKEEQSLAAFLSNRQSRPLIGALRRAGLLRSEQALHNISPDGAHFTSEGRSWFKRLILQALVPDAVLLEEADAEFCESLVRVAPWLLSAAAQGDPWDLRPLLRSAVEDLVEMRRKGISSVDDYLQESISKEPPAVIDSSLGRILLRILFEIGAQPGLVMPLARDFLRCARQHFDAPDSRHPF